MKIQSGLLEPRADRRQLPSLAVGSLMADEIEPLTVDEGTGLNP